MKLIVYFLGLYLCSNFSPTYAAKPFLIIKEGETISNVLYDLNIEPIYGKGNALEMTLKLNPKVYKKHRGNKIFPNTKIYLPDLEKFKKFVIDKKTPKDDAAESIKAPLPPAVVPVTEEWKKTIVVQFLPQISWLTLDSNSDNELQNSQVSLMSKMGYGISGSFLVNYSKNFALGGRLSLSKINFQPNNQYLLSKQNFLKVDLGIQSEFHFHDQYIISVEIGVKDELFLNVIDDANININNAKIPQMKIAMKRSFGEYNHFSIVPGLHGILKFPFKTSAIDGKMGYGYGGDLLLIKQKKGIQFFYNIDDAKARNLSTKSREFGWNFIIESQILE